MEKCRTLTLARRLVLDLPTPEGWKAELTYRLPGNATVGSRIRDLSSLDHKSNALTTTPPSRVTEGNHHSDLGSVLRKFRFSAIL